MFYDSRKKQIIWNYVFEMFEDEIHNMNKTRYSDIRTYTEAKSMSILSKERKSKKVNKSSDNKKPRENSSGASNAGNNKNKKSNQKKKYQQSNMTSSGNKNSSK